jgi:hypothetical protein
VWLEAHVIEGDHTFDIPLLITQVFLITSVRTERTT